MKTLYLAKNIRAVIHIDSMISVDDIWSIISIDEILTSENIFIIVNILNVHRTITNIVICQYKFVSVGKRSVLKITNKISSIY